MGSDSSSSNEGGATHSAIAFASGGFGGACLAVVGAPFDYVKVRQQVGEASSQSTVASVIRNIVAREGVRGLWRGVVPQLLQAIPNFAIVNTVFDFNRRVVQRWSGRPKGNLRDTAIAGGLVAVPTSFLYTPFDRVKCVLQADGRRIARGLQPRFASPFMCAHHLWSRGSLFRGFGITLARDVPAFAAFFLAYASAKRLLTSSTTALDGHSELTVAASLASGACAGATTWAVAIPCDNVKTRYQGAASGREAEARRPCVTC
jgi:solute carrier family 25 carnitine/acylcarnitine transporter 20/29